MSLDRIFNIAGSALNAQTTRMNTTASNLANAGTVSGNEGEAFRAKRAMFKTILEQQPNLMNKVMKAAYELKKSWTTLHRFEKCLTQATPWPTKTAMCIWPT